jgi:hypothetical protein
VRREYNDTGVCAICTKVIQEDEPRYGITGNHYDCEKPVSDTDFKKMADDVMKSADAAMAALRKRFPQHPRRSK